MIDSTIFWLVLTVVCLSIATYCLFTPPRNPLRRVDQELGASKFTSKTTKIV
jgi:hypothetical protein